DNAEATDFAHRHDSDSNICGALCRPDPTPLSSLLVSTVPVRGASIARSFSWFCNRPICSAEDVTDDWLPHLSGSLSVDGWSKTERITAPTEPKNMPSRAAPNNTEGIGTPQAATR